VAGDILRLAVVGHVDHGKSSVIGRLLIDAGAVSTDRMSELSAASGASRAVDPAYVTDSLEEERARSVTIDTSEARLAAHGREYAIIDTPGHRQFLKNMVTGASRADAAVLVVDANLGVREQTRRHVHVLRMLGVRQVVVAANKMDLAAFASASLASLRDQIAPLLEGMTVVGTVPVSARRGDNIVRRSTDMPWYEGDTLLDALSHLAPAEPTADRPLRMPVQGARPKADGAILVYGRVESGRVATGDEIVFCPSGIGTTVVSIAHANGNGRDTASAGMSIGIVVGDHVLPPPGEVICHRTAPAATARRLSATVFWLDGTPLCAGTNLTARCASQVVECVVERVRPDPAEAGDGTCLVDGQMGAVDIRTSWPLAADRFERIPQLGRLAFSQDGRLVGAGVIASIGEGRGS